MHLCSDLPQTSTNYYLLGPLIYIMSEKFLSWAKYIQNGLPPCDINKRHKSRRTWVASYLCKMACEQINSFSGPEHIINKGKNLKVPASTLGFTTEQSDKPADRAARWMDGRKVRSADIYTSVGRERREQTHINMKRWVEGMTCRVDLTNPGLDFFLRGDISWSQVMKTCGLWEARLLTRRAPVHTHAEKKPFWFRVIFHHSNRFYLIVSTIIKIPQIYILNTLKSTVESLIHITKRRKTKFANFLPY